ncbi:MAG: GHKL domain-containing protein [Finegoldia magna]|nr:GHKL domain-containing protein [Finegoldia magna]
MGNSTFLKLSFLTVANLAISFMFFDGTAYKKVFYVISFICNFTLYEVVGLSFSYSSIYKDFFGIDFSFYYIILYLAFLILFYVYIKFIKDGSYENFDLDNTEYLILTIVFLCNLVMLMVLGDYSYKISIVLIFVAILSDFCYVFFHRKIKEKNLILSKYQVVDEQNKILKREIENEANFRRLKHDLKNTLLQVDMNIKSGDTNLAIAQIENIVGQKLDNPTYLSGLTEIDYLLSMKIQKMEQLNIKHKISLQIPKDLNIKEISIDLSAIIGNLIDNAIEAVERLGDVDSPIIIKLIYRDEKIYVYTENPSEKLEEDFSKDFIKSSKSDRFGVGIKSIKLRLEKLKGFYNFKYEDGSFKVLIIVPCKLKNPKS